MPCADRPWITAEHRGMRWRVGCSIGVRAGFKLREVPRPTPGSGEALVKTTLTTICGADVHILKGEYPVEHGLVVGHEPVRVVEELGRGVTGSAPGDRVIVGAITPCGQCRAPRSSAGT